MADPRLVRLCVFAVVIIVGTQLLLTDAEDPAEPYLAKARREIAQGQYEDAESAFNAGLEKLHRHPRLRLAFAEFLRDDRHDDFRAESEFTTFAGEAGIRDHLQMVAWREAGELAWLRRDHATAAKDFANAQADDRQSWVLATWLRGSDGDQTAWTAIPPKRTGADGKELPDDAAVYLWLAAQPGTNAGSARDDLHRAAVAQAAADAAAAAITGADQDENAAKPPGDSDPALAPSPFIRYLTARVHATLGDDETAAMVLEDAGRTARALPLTQADARADPAFAQAGPLLSKAIAKLPKR